MAGEEPKTVFMWAPSANMCWWQQQDHAEGIANVQGKMTSNGESEEPVSHRTENVYHMEAKLKEEGDYSLEIMATGTLESHFPRGTWMEELSPIVKDLCNHTAMKATLQRQAEIPALSNFAGYFLDKVMEILDEDYQPSEDDIFRVEGFTQGSGLMDIEFCLEDKIPLSQSCWQDAHSPIGSMLNVKDEVNAGHVRLQVKSCLVNSVPPTE
ncbi:unnamed protein product [Sphagnum troendelagicum]